MVNNIPTEAQEQTALFQWAAMMQGRIPELALLHSVPNGGSRHPIEAVHLKQQGVKPGIPDIFLPCARGPWHGLYIEMKRRKGGRVSVDQQRMILSLRAQGYRVEVCEGWENAKNVIMEYMRDGTV
jgi:hypothetical protein